MTDPTIRAAIPADAPEPSALIDEQGFSLKDEAIYPHAENG
jgi:hypothetical protein